MSSIKDSIRIGNMLVKNRMVLPPMNSNYSNELGGVTPQMIEFYADRARNGVGLLVMEALSVVPEPKNHGVQPMIYDEKFVPGWFNLTDRVHSYGAKISAELAHYGSEGAIGRKVSSSNVSHYVDEPVHAMSIEEIKECEDQFAEAAYWSQVAGFDAVTLHATHGYLMSQFLSPIYNKRTDEYGGTLTNRLRFIRHVIEKTKERLGARYPVMVRISSDEFFAGGIEIDEAVQIAVRLEEYGADAIDVSTGMTASYLFNIRPYSLTPLEGYNIENVRRIKHAVNVPVIYACGVREPEMAEKIVSDGAADMVCFGRQLLADERYCMKILGEDADPIRYCLSCQECLTKMTMGRSLRCTVNPRTGREWLWPQEITQAREKKRVAVAGAGPAGMEAALTAAQRGHDVTLYEKKDRIGGTLAAAAVPPGKHRIADLIRYYEYMLKKAQVKIVTNTEYTSAAAAEEKPDVVVFGGGARFMRVIKGSEGSHVLTAVEALEHPEKAGQNVVIIGGGVSGCETAEYFCDEAVEIEYRRIKNFQEDIEYRARLREGAHPKNITVVEMMDRLCGDMDEYNRATMMIKLKENGVGQYVNTRVEEITDHGVTLRDTGTGKVFVQKADTIILAAGLKPQNAEESYGGAKVYYAGDSGQIGKIIDAVYSGRCIGLNI
ncbi:FAD-dependent oxidoreductase [Extibacter muris]|uniref:oxidoreductase n=1 Tax=Extibacter muris TaxID=1796622 RepID=UPI001D06B91B|nr:FAD-dependent oxidoreductase [Extibacter muris]MCB6201902.1 FAD-dependent oxidoreductase [Extibacter muris]MCQ4663239.1 FAD-dependent oxidoreductase [Extibacter muris]MCQ4692483.1 FAD-dependent oxidoreductase [Extibacter muris]